MNRICFLSAALVAVGASMASAQSDFTLGFTGPGSQSGSSGDAWSGDYNCTLADSGGGPGAQGWSLSVTADDAAINSITFDGTEAAALYSGGFKKSELTTKGVDDCAGKNGAVSAVVLSFTENKVLVAGATTQIAIINVSGAIPAGGGTSTLRYVNKCQGAGQPVQHAVTENGATKNPTLGTLDIALREVQSCCNAQVNVGFSSSKVDSATTYDGIVDAEGDPAICDGAGGEIVTEVPAGGQGEGHVYASISSKDAGGGVQGWSFSIALSGDGANLTGLTPDGTPGVDQNYSGGFKKTEIVDPAKNSDQRGGVSAVVLSFTENKVLPAIGTSSVLDIALQAAAVQGDPDQTASLAYQNGLRGSGQPVQNAITVDGNTLNACNAGTAAVNVIFRIEPVGQNGSFIRGNPNGDSKVDIADAVWIINELIRGGPASACPDAADANDDGMEDSSDAVYLINFLFRSGPSLPPPYPDCGTDTTGEDPAATCPADSTTCP